jgi:hypothetical protein
MAKQSLSDILRGSGGDDFFSNWDSTEAAGDFEPLPPGTYLLRILNGELFNSRQRGTPGFKLTCQVAEGQFEGRYVWHDIWLTGPALPMAKRDLAKLGITQAEQLEEPFPRGLLIRAKIALRKDDDGNERNRVVRFEFAGVEPGDTFEPPAGGDADGAGAAGGDTPFDVPDIGPEQGKSQETPGGEGQP